MLAFKHVVMRLYLLFLMSLFFLTGGLAMFVLAPLYKGAFVPRAPWRDVRVFHLWAHTYRVIWRTLSSKDYRDLFPSKLTDPPMFSNDPSAMRIKASWQGTADNCDGCQNSCCAQIKCPMLMANGRCLSYGSIYYGYFYCGRYPSSQGQIDLYQCPKWEERF